MKKSGASQGQSASELISKRIAELGDWRGKTLSRMRTLIKQADPDVVEEWKWMGTPIWSHDGIICTGESYKNVVKLTFAKGASLQDPARLFNSSLDGNVRRAIDIHEGEEVDESVVAGGVKIESLNLWVKGRRAARVPLQRTGEGLTPYAFALVFPQDAHERLLIERLSALGVRVERQTELLRFTQHGTGVTATLRRPDGSEEVCEAAYLAGCDGASSTVRTQLGVGFPGG